MFLHSLKASNPQLDIQTGIIEHLEPQKATLYYKRIAEHHAANGGLSEAEGFWLKAGMPMEAVGMYMKAGEEALACCWDCSALYRNHQHHFAALPQTV